MLQLLLKGGHCSGGPPSLRSRPLGLTPSSLAPTFTSGAPSVPGSDASLKPGPHVDRRRPRVALPSTLPLTFTSGAPSLLETLPSLLSTLGDDELEIIFGKLALALTLTTAPDP